MTAQIDAWLLPVVPGAADGDRLVAAVGTGERDRISRLGRRADRDRAVCARVAARTAIGRRLGMPAAEVPLRRRGERRWFAGTAVR